MKNGMAKSLINVFNHEIYGDLFQKKSKNGNFHDSALKLYSSLKTGLLEKISELDLSSCKLVDITCSIRNLPLRKINLSDNKLIQIPRCFYLGLEILEYLDISNNGITNFEVEPNCCRTLRVLNISSNKLKDIPQWIMNHRAVALKQLSYDFNKITSLRCIFGSNMKFSVPKLSLKNCILRDADCDFLKNCIYLEELDISNVEETQLNLNFIKTVDKLLYQPNWKNLSILKMSNLSLSVFPEGLTWLEGLSELYLANNQFMWLPKDGLEYLVNLEIFDLSHNLISDLPEKLAWLEYMKVLNLSYNKLEITCDFSKMKSLEVLDLYCNKLVNFDHDLITTNLKCLDVEMNCFDTTLWKFLTYEEMKDKLRLRIPEEKRVDGESYLYELSNYSESSGSVSCNSSEVSEDWDKELELLEQITPSDDEWKGESPSLPHIPIYYYEKPRVYNDDVIFCDAD